MHNFNQNSIYFIWYIVKCIILSQVESINLVFVVIGKLNYI